MPELQEAKNNASKKYQSFISEAAFSMDQATCIWFFEDTDLPPKCIQR